MTLMVPTPFGMVPAGALGALRGYDWAAVVLAVSTLAPGPGALVLPACALVWQWGRSVHADRRPPTADRRPDGGR